MIVLGIDAAWTMFNPSGVALVERDGGAWRLIGCHAGYPDFLETDCGHVADPVALLARSAALAGRAVDLVAIDMPLARSPITQRRASDNAVSRLFGARHCSTHTPSVERPGPVSDRMREAFAVAGYGLATDRIPARALIEVYPHPALLALTGAAMRLPYKYGKTSKYWPNLDAPRRRLKLLDVWAEIVAALDQEIAGVAARLPLPSADDAAVRMKAFEDTLDAIVCTWVGIRALEGTAAPLGDDDSAIWVPTAERGS